MAPRTLYGLFATGGEAFSRARLADVKTVTKATAHLHDGQVPQTAEAHGLTSSRIRARPPIK